MRKIYYWFIFVFLLCSVRVSAQTYSWANEYGSTVGGSFTDEETIRDIAVDASGNTYVIGTQKGQITDLATTGGTGTLSDVFIAKLDATGTIVWYQQSIGKSLTDRGLAIAVSSAGDVYFGGSLYGNIFIKSVAGENLKGSGTSTPSPDMFVCKYTSAGAYVWARGVGMLNNSTQDEVADIALDASGNVYLAGYVETNGTAIDVYTDGNARTVLGSFAAYSAGLEAALVKLASDGSFVSAYSFGSAAGAEKFNSIAIDASNNIFLSGVFSNTVDFDPTAAVSNVTESSPQGSGDAFIVKYTSAMALVWAGSIKGVNQEFVNALDTDPSGDLYAVGSFQGFENFDLFGGTQNLTSVGSPDIFVAKYNGSDGSYIDAYQIGGSGTNTANGINVISSGDYYLTGDFSGTANFNPKGTAKNVTAAGSTDAFLCHYTSASANTWVMTAGSTGADGGYSSNIASDGKVIWGGFFTGTADFDPSATTHALTSVGAEDMFLAAYTECVGAAITTQPATTQTICTGQNATFSVVASGTGLTYAWKKGGVALSNGGTISGATSATLTITGLVAGDAATYTVDVIGCTGTVTSGNSVLTVPAGAAITTQPIATQTLCAGVAASMSVTATGTGLTYQWKKGGVALSNGGTISGALTATLNISSLVAGDAANYTVDVTATGCGAPLTSSTSVLAVNAAPAITVQPAASQTLCAGAAATFSVTATGAGLTYQWKKAGVSISDGGTISGALTASLNISSVVAGDAANYTVVVTGTCGTPVTSSVSALVVSTGAAISVQPAATQTLCTGGAATFSVTASGAGLTYQWQKGGVNVSNGGTVSGALTSSLAISSLVSGDAGNYTVIVSSTCGAPVTSSTSVLTVNTGAAITTQPTAAQAICVGAAASFSVTATGTGLSYQWKKGGVALSNGGTISGALTATLNISAVAAGDAANYTVDVTATGCGSPVTSSISALTVNAAAAITAQPAATQTKCTGTAVSFSVTATGAGLTYQWKKGGTALTDGGTISGSLTSTLNISSVVAGDAATYTVVVTGTCGAPVTSSNAVLNVNSSAAITTQPIVNQTLCVGDLAVFSVSATGTSLTYQWQKNGTNVTNGGGTFGATSTSLSISSVIAANAGNYTCIVTATGCGSPVTSNTSVLVVNSYTSITTQPPASQTSCTGQSLSLAVVATGSGLTYQWQKGGVDVPNGGTVSGAQTATLNISSLALGDAGNYTVIVSGLCGSPLTSSTSALTVNTGATITSQPTASQTLCAGAPASFSVSTTGTGLTYQWQKGGVDITNGGTVSGALTSTLAISSLVVADAGNYTVNITVPGCSGMLTSSTAALTINSPAAITAQPNPSQTKCTGNVASFSVTATGTSLTYQWQLNGTNLVDGGTISGALTSTLNISSLVAGDAGNYTVNVTASCGAVATSATAVLVVNSAAVITAQPIATQTLCVGSPAAFSVTATGTSLTYQWQKGGVNISNGGTVSGALTSSLAISSVVAGDVGNYTVNVTAAGCGAPVTSSVSALTVQIPAAITAQPNPSQTKCTGNSVSFSVTATGTSLTYQWQKGGVDVIDGGTISGATTSTLSISSLVAGDAGNYTVNVTAACGAVATSATAALVVNIGAAITTQPVATQTLCAGSPAAFSVTATGTSLTYQWQLNGTNLTNGGTVSGALTSSLAISSLVAGDAGNYTVNITAAGCGAPITSSTSALTVQVPAAITAQPNPSQTLCTGNAALFSVTATGTSLTYQWQLNGTNLVDGGTISGALTSTLNISSLVSGDAGNYTVNVTAACGALATSAAAVLVVNSGAAITAQPMATQTLCVGSPAAFSVTATGTSITYQWQLNGSNLTDGGTISGALTSTLNISSLVAGDAGNYTVNVTAPGCGAITSATSALTVNIPAAITAQPNPSQTLCTGNAASFNVTATGTSLTYQWQLNGTDVVDGGTISGAQTASLNISSLVAGDAGNYTVNVTAACGAVATSATAALTVNIGATITAQPNPSQTLCTGLPAAFSVTATGTGLTYQWQLGGVDVVDGGTISGATTANLAISAVASGDAGNYTCNVGAVGCGTPITTSLAALIVNSPVAIITQPAPSQTSCTSQSVSFTVAATGSGLTYQWQFNGTNLTDGGTISGALTTTLTNASLASADAGNYTVIITGVCGSPVTSATSALTVNTGAAITSQPNPSQTLCAGAAASFSVTATGTSVTYQWQKGGVNLVDGGTLSGALTATLNISSAVASDAGNYTCNISASGCGTPLTTTVAALVVNTPVVITSQPNASQSLCTGAAASISVTATGSSLTYQWQKGGVNVVDGGTISGALTASLSISSTVTTDAGNYTVIITGTCGAPLTSTVSVLNVTSSITITSQPLDVNACTGSSANFDLTASGAGLTYQWQKGGVNTVDGALISGSQTSSLVFSSVAVSDAGSYTCIISGSCGVPVTSNTVNLTVSAGATITKQPISSFICLNQQASFTILATGATSYQWQFKPSGGSYADISNGANVSGATTNTLVINNSQFTDRGNYRCVVGGGSCAGGTQSAAASLSFQSPSIVSQPLSQSLCNGQIVTFGVVALGNNLTYTWVKDGVTVHNGGTISGATSPTLKITNVGGIDAGTYYCEVQGLCPPPVFSDNVDLTITYCTAVTDPLEESLFNIYPNPSVGIAYLDLNMYAAGSLTYEVFNTLGESITSSSISGEGKVISVIDLEGQPAGVYIVKINYQDKQSWQRLVVEK